NVEVVTDEPGQQWERQDEFQVVANNKDAQEQRKTGRVEEHADQQLLIVVMTERLAVSASDSAVTKGAILGQTLGRHEEGPNHPVSDEERNGWEERGGHHEPAQQQPDWVVDGF